MISHDDLPHASRDEQGWLELLPVRSRLLQVNRVQGRDQRWAVKALEQRCSSLGAKTRVTKAGGVLIKLAGWCAALQSARHDNSYVGDHSDDGGVWPRPRCVIARCPQARSKATDGSYRSKLLAQPNTSSPGGARDLEEWRSDLEVWRSGPAADVDPGSTE